MFFGRKKMSPAERAEAVKYYYESVGMYIAFD